jgi:spermidine/putrescine transport system permease protein
VDSWRRNPLVFWIFSIPPSTWLVAFFLAPLALVWVMSFGEKRGIIDIAITGTLENYWRALDPLYLQIFAKSFWFAGITTVISLLAAFSLSIAFFSTIISTVLGTMVAIMLWRFRFPFK